MNRIKSIGIPAAENNIINLENMEIYHGIYHGHNSLFFVAGGQVMRIDESGYINQGGIDYYQCELINIRKVTTKVRIIVED